MHFELLKKYCKTAKIVFSILFLFVVLDFVFPLPDKIEFSKEIHAKDGTLLTAYLTKDDKWRMRTELDKVSPDLIKAVIEKEDSWFYWHIGINPVSVVRALYQNIFNGKIESGASTITMQVARLLEPKKRTYLNKFVEMFRALQLEVKYSKKEILELYLSLLPFGGNIEGVKSASYIYFNRTPDKLSLAQSITLTVIPNDPNVFRLDRSNEELLSKRNYWIKKFNSKNIFSKPDLNDALDDPTENNRNAIPVLAPHFSQFVKDNFDGDIINTTLDLSKQQIAETILLRHVRKVFYKGITNGAVLVIDNKNSSIVSYCGSADFYDAGSFGQVNGVTATRSPGSTLKAALYAYAFDEGNLTPQMKIEDIPTDFHGYQPENYDLKFYGNVSAEFALVNSLNIPAVKLLERTGLNNFTNFLASSGFNQIQKVEGKQIFSEASSYMVAQILSGINRSDIVNLSSYSKLPKFAWKTGTSYGKRDAWAIGFNPNYTIGVWMGNFNGVGSPNLSGAEVAVPVLFDLFNAIDYNSDVKWFDIPEELLTRKVCAESGLIPTQYCKNVVTDYAIKNRSTNDFCDIHKPIYVDNDETIQYCTSCLPNSNCKKVVYPVYSPELTIWLSQNKKDSHSPPQHNPECTAKFAQGGPKILSPSEDYEYFIEKNSGQEILLLAASDSRVKTQYWYVNDKYFRKCKPGDKVFFKPDDGQLKITCLDDKGRDGIVKVKINYY
ncbi:MAG: transglycosylase domain-containing protein [Ignavibacteriaceae bacterium]